MLHDKSRITHQREVIMEELRMVKTHPTADELFAQVRRRLPRVSLATVYRNLEWLAGQGLAQKIEVCGRQMRFDGNPQEHYHIRCRHCGRVDDLAVDPLPNLESHIGTECDYVILGHRLEFTGICPACNPSAERITA